MKPSAIQIARRLFLMLTVGGTLFFLMKRPDADGDSVSKIIETLSRKVLSSLAGVED